MGSDPTEASQEALWFDLSSGISESAPPFCTLRKERAQVTQRRTPDRPLSGPCHRRSSSSCRRCRCPPLHHRQSWLREMRRVGNCPPHRYRSILSPPRSEERRVGNVLATRTSV